MTKPTITRGIEWYETPAPPPQRTRWAWFVTGATEAWHVVRTPIERPSRGLWAAWHAARGWGRLAVAVAAAVTVSTIAAALGAPDAMAGAAGGCYGMLVLSRCEAND